MSNFLSSVYLCNYVTIIISVYRLVVLNSWYRWNCPRDLFIALVIKENLPWLTSRQRFFLKYANSGAISNRWSTYQVNVNQFQEVKLEALIWMSLVTGQNEFGWIQAGPTRQGANKFWCIFPSLWILNVLNMTLIHFLTF